VLGLFPVPSCDYSVEPREASYPDQKIYLPAAYGGGQFVIDNIAGRRGDVPIEGHTYRYEVDVTQREFRVPLSVYRAGVDNNGSFTVSIHANTDFIATLNGGRTENNQLLLIPSDQYSISANSVELNDGESFAPFELIVNLDFLRENTPDKIYAIGVEITSEQRERNPNLSIAAIIIHTKMIKPSANFTYSANASQAHSINFLNSSTMSSAYRWDFGDGASSDQPSPSHNYTEAGIYRVGLTALGVTGEEDKSEIEVEVTVP
jgi:PKD repeat protein